MRNPQETSVHCDCRAKSVRNARVIAIAVAVCAFITRTIAFGSASAERAVCGLVIGLAFATYGVATLFDDTATFPKPVYAVIAAAGAALAALRISQLL